LIFALFLNQNLKMIKNLLLSGILAILVFSCNTRETKNTEAKDILVEDLDTTVSPAKDFFQYANGGWIKKNPIPAEQATWGIGNLVLEENLKRFREINEKASSSNAARGTSDQKIGDFWKTGMDSAKAERLGLKPLQPLFDKINAIADEHSLLTVVAELKKIGSEGLFLDFVNQDSKNSAAMVYTIWQGGIGLPEREYYFKNDSATIDIRNAYVNYIARTINMSGGDTTTSLSDAKNILSLETRLALGSRKLEDLRDDYKNYNKVAVTDLPKISARIDWTTYLPAIGVNKVDSIIVGQPEFFAALDKVLKTTPIDLWKKYLKVRLIYSFADALPDAYGIERFKFERLFTGAEERRPRWKRVINQENYLLGELLGQLYVKEYISPNDKKRYEQMTEGIRDALKDHISKLNWMGESTKEKAFTKLASMKKKVFYPDKWKDYSALIIDTNSYVENLIKADLWEHQFEYNKLGKPVNRDEWGMTPQTYNAEYNASNNDITLPAAQFIVPGFKDEELDDALVYGYSAASTIGHEITHGFDDQGRKYDAQGNLSKWWTDKDSAEFTKRAKVIINQFSGYEPVKGYHINGEASQGENIADLGGILLGIDAFKKTDQYKKGEKINGLTPMQRFFLGYALGWLGQERQEVLRSQLMTDVHAPAKYRVNGPFSDVDEFYTTFDVKPGDPMYLADSLRARIW
jgi:putative endopeptidase